MRIINRGSLDSFAAGALLARALPQTALAAGWHMAALLGAPIGAVTALAIFSLSCAIVNISSSESINAQKISSIAAAAFYMLFCSIERDYSLASVSFVYFIFDLADCLLILFAVLLPIWRRKVSFIIVIVSALLFRLLCNCIVPHILRLEAIIAPISAALLCAVSMNLLAYRNKAMDMRAFLFAVSASIACDIFI